jgi:hypothetical protein
VTTALRHICSLVRGYYDEVSFYHHNREGHVLNEVQNGLANWTGKPAEITRVHSEAIAFVDRWLSEWKPSGMDRTVPGLARLPPCPLPMRMY